MHFLFKTPIFRGLLYKREHVWNHWLFVSPSSAKKSTMFYEHSQLDFQNNGKIMAASNLLLYFNVNRFNDLFYKHYLFNCYWLKFNLKTFNRPFLLLIPYINPRAILQFLHRKQETLSHCIWKIMCTIKRQTFEENQH